VATRVRDWETVDYYGVLGVRPGASSDEITRAFRAAAKQLHPDTNADPVALERFKDVSAAYAVLSDDALRRDYDLVRDGVVTATAEVRPPNVGARPPRPARKPWSRTKSITALVSGIVLALLGVLALGVTVVLHNNDAAQRARFIPVTAQRVENGDITFRTRDNVAVTTKEPRRRGDPTGSGLTVKVRYDPANPKHVIVDDTTLGRDITLAIVGLKLLVGGAVFTVVGARKLRAATAVR
jgi:curved DNA-binding protein CbpA